MRPVTPRRPYMGAAMDLAMNLTKDDTQQVFGTRAITMD
jgi:hypothetical protein